MKRILKKFIPEIILSFYHKILAVLADVFYGNPSGKMIVIGVTGTNGKSTTVNLIGRVLEKAGYKVGWTTTANFKIADKEWLNNFKMTMLGRFKLQKFLKQMVNVGCEYAIIETSSEGIKQHRHLGINYDVAVFTNLTPEHIESHGSFENYKKAKLELFRHVAVSSRKKINGQEIKKVSVVNIDDEHGKDFLALETDEAWGFGVENRGQENLSRVVRAFEPKLTREGVNFKIQNTEFNLRLHGEFNIYNSLAAVAVGLSQGINLLICKAALEKVRGIPGRMEFINEGQDFTVIVDYAPEPVSLQKLYETLKVSGLYNLENKIIHVLGSCGGGRDTARRPVLGEIAGRNADYVITTNEDPYDDDPELIITAVAEGALAVGKILGENLFKISDRGDAIKKAISLAGAGDLVLITGKGCEQAIVVANNKKIPWDDRVVVREMMRKKLNKSQIPNTKSQINSKT